MSLVALDDARHKVFEAVSVLKSEDISVSQALGRTAAIDIAARMTQPPQNVSAMDGYALDSSSAQGLPFYLDVVGESQAGHGFDGFVGPTQAVRIFTGALVPGGADCVIMQEDCERSGDRVLIKENPFAGKYVRPKGFDFAAEDILISKGTLLTARHIGLLSAMNIPWVKVYRKPKVGIIATGDELVMPGEAVGVSQIISSNSLMVAALVEALGAESVNLGIAKDDEASLRAKLSGLSGLDLLITCGGVSVGKYDLVTNVLGQEGLEINFYKIAMKPGKPFMFGRLKDTLVMGLPGNPVSAFVTAHTFLRPALLKMQGLEYQSDETVKARLAKSLRENTQRYDFMRTRLGRDIDGSLIADPFSAQDSSLISRLAACDGFILRPPHDPARNEGDFVNVLPVSNGLVRV